MLAKCKPLKVHKPSKSPTSFGSNFEPTADKPRNVHSNQSVFECDFCDSSFSRLYHLTRHIQNVHNRGEFPCDQCDHVSVSKGALEQHKVCKHTEFTNDFHCAKCEKSFRYKRDLIYHEEYAHKIDPVTCEICGKEYDNSLKLKSHMQSTHSGKVRKHTKKERQGKGS